MQYIQVGKNCLYLQNIPFLTLNSNTLETKICYLYYDTNHVLSHNSPRNPEHIFTVIWNCCAGLAIIIVICYNHCDLYRCLKNYPTKVSECRNSDAWLWYIWKVCYLYFHCCDSRKTCRSQNYVVMQYTIEVFKYTTSTLGNEISTIFIESGQAVFQLDDLVFLSSEKWRFGKSLMADWLGWASQGHEMFCHELDVMASNPSRVKLGVHSTFV